MAAGVLNSLGLLSSTYALSIGKISVVNPIVAAEPLVAVVLSAFLLLNLDRVTPRTVMAVVLTVAGVLYGCIVVIALDTGLTLDCEEI